MAACVSRRKVRETIYDEILCIPLVDRGRCMRIKFEWEIGSVLNYKSIINISTSVCGGIYAEEAENMFFQITQSYIARSFSRAPSRVVSSFLIEIKRQRIYL